jgi:hypothetical protein
MAASLWITRADGTVVRWRKSGRTDVPDQRASAVRKSGTGASGRGASVFVRVRPVGEVTPMVGTISIPGIGTADELEVPAR